MLGCIRKQDPTIYSTYMKHIIDQRYKQTESKRTEKDTPCNQQP